MSANPGYNKLNPTVSGRVGNPMAAVGEIGYINPGGEVATSGIPSVGMGAKASPSSSSWDNFRKNLDKDFLSALGGSIGGGAGLDASAPGHIKVGSGSARFSPIGGQGLPVPDMAPNPGWPSVLPRRKRDQYSGGF